MSDEKDAENKKIYIHIYLYVPFIYTRPGGGANYLVLKI